MTTPPKARRYHKSVDESQKAGEAQPVPPGQTKQENDPAPKPQAPKPVFASKPFARVEVQKKAFQRDQLSANQQPKTEQTPTTREKLQAPTPHDDGFGDRSFRRQDEMPETSSAASDKAPKDSGPKDEELEKQLQAIREENLGERKLRTARRVAALHQIQVDSDEEAVLRLREKGVDLSNRATIGKLLADDGANARRAPGKNVPSVMPQPQPPSTIPPGGAMASPNGPPKMDNEQRAAEIRQIQIEIARRRKRRVAMLFLRMFLFIVIPTAVVGWYYFSVATPLYSTYTQFKIQSADLAGGGGAGGGGRGCRGSAGRSGRDCGSALPEFSPGHAATERRSRL